MRALLLLLPGVLAMVGCSTAPRGGALKTVERVDLDRYMGRWQVIAYTPNFIEDGKVAAADIYARRPDGRIDNVYAFRKGTLDAPEKRWNGVAWVTNPATNAEWKVRLLWPFTSEYLILELDADYRWAVVASNGGKLLWVLARDTTMDPALYADLVGRLKARRLAAADELTRVPQREDAGAASAPVGGK